MKIAKLLNELKNKQEALVKQLDTVISEAMKSTDIIENEKVKNELDHLTAEMATLEKKYTLILNQNQEIKQALNEQIIDEKLNILKISKQKLELYFGREKEKYENRLADFEHEIKYKIGRHRLTATKNLADEKNQALKDISDLEMKIAERIKIYREKIQQEEAEILKNLHNGIENLSGKEMDEKTIQKRIKQNKLEMKIGLNWLNKIGMLLIIIAIGITAYYNRENVNNFIKSILFYLMGAIAIGAGEYFYRKQKEPFAIGILGGGIAILYSATFFSYFVLKENGTSIIDTNAALILSVIISLTTIVLSLRYNSQIIISFGLVGGYLPFLTYALAFGFTGNQYYYAMIYLFILNLIVLAISFIKQWRITNYLSFIFNLPALVYLIDNSHNNLINLLYTMLTFLMYLIIIIAFPLLHKKSLKIPDLILLAANTITNSVIIYLLFMQLKWTDFNGVLALGFCLIYFGLGFFASKWMNAEKGTIVIFYLTAMTFAVLMMPFQFGRNWFLLGWLVEGTLLSIYGYKKNMKELELAGWGIFTLCVVTFYTYDLLGNYFNSDNFQLKYALTTAASLLILVIYQLDVYKNHISEFSLKGKWITGFKYFTIISFYLFLITNTLYYTEKIFLTNYSTNKILPYDIYVFFRLILFALITMGMGVLLKNIKFLYDKIIKIFYLTFFLISDLFCFFIILRKPVLNYSLFDFINNSPVYYIALLILVIYNIFVIVNVKNLFAALINYTKTNFELVPLWVGIILLGNVTGFMVRQLNMDDVSIIIGFVYIILALLSISYGFWHKFLYIRMFGLVLIFIAIGILFLRIFIYTDTPGKIISFFGFGILLIFISFIYQVMNKKMEKRVRKE